MTRNWFTRRTALSKAPRRGPRLRLERLEDRATPATFLVNSTADDAPVAGDGKLTLREAISKANLDPATADVIVVPAGVYKVALESGDDSSGGDFDITGNVTIRGAGAGRTIIDGQKKDRVFEVRGTSPGSIRAVFQGVTIRNGETAGLGGGILVQDAELVIRDSAVVGNSTSQDGGGLYIGTSVTDARVVRTTVARNVADFHGGGLASGLSSRPIVTDSTIRRNIAAEGVGGGIQAVSATLTNSTVSGNYAYGNGGGISVGTVTLTNSTVSGNYSHLHGGGINATGEATLTNSTVSGNEVRGSGGGIHAVTATLNNSIVSSNSAGTDGGGVHAGTAMLTRSTVSDNTAQGAGGGIHAGTSTLNRSTVSGNTAQGIGGGIRAVDEANLTNSTVSGNTAGAIGGGILAPAAALLNCTVVENIAFGGGGLCHDPGGTFTLRNSIVALNLDGFQTVADVQGDFLSEGHTLIGDGIGGVGFISTDIVGTSTSPIDPKIGALKNNGGPTKTHALLAGSKAIDRGDNSLLPPTDQRGAGFPRVKDGNGDGIARVDIGAFEL